MKKSHALRHRKLSARQWADDRAVRAPQVDTTRREAFARDRVPRWRGGPFRPPAFGGGAYLAIAAADMMKGQS